MVVDNKAWYSPVGQGKSRPAGFSRFSEKKPATLLILSLTLGILTMKVAFRLAAGLAQRVRGGEFSVRRARQARRLNGGIRDRCNIPTPYG
jgi:hypothetical protein